MATFESQNGMPACSGTSPTTSSIHRSGQRNSRARRFASMDLPVPGSPENMTSVDRMFRSSCQQTFGGLVMSFGKLAFIHCSQLSFLDDEAAVDHGVIHTDGLAEDNRRDWVVHTGKFDAIQIDREEIRTLSTVQTPNIVSSQYSRAPTRAEIQGFPCRHQLSDLTLSFGHPS